jgi:hypothetical protein
MALIHYMQSVQISQPSPYDLPLQPYRPSSGRRLLVLRYIEGLLYPPTKKQSSQRVCIYRSDSPVACIHTLEQW